MPKANTPRRIDPQRFIDILLPVVRQCAQASLLFHGKVANLGKAEDTRLSGRSAQVASGALTALDNAFQDILLTVVLEHFGGIRLIAEENTPLKRRFAGNASDYTLIIDPIDGTLHFVQGDGPYHISLGLAHKGQMVAALVARPTQDKIFTAIKGRGAFVRLGTKKPRRLRLGAKPKTKRAFISSKARAYQAAARGRLEPREYPIGAALVLTQIAEGDLCAYLTRQIEIYDAGPPSLIAEEAGARCFLKSNLAPTYDRRRKIDHFFCAATPQLEHFLLDVVRTVDKKEKIQR